ncbi:MAG: polyprenyl synthetase family protein [Candidatus Bathyarchaeia archaeon]
MTSKSNLVEAFKLIVDEKGSKALKDARAELLDSTNDDSAVTLALKHFAKVTLSSAVPVFPSLISLACEAVGGKSEKTALVGKAIILIAGAADIHDDIIDNSQIKGSKRTVLGQFGREIAILTGDVLLVNGLSQLQRECQSLSKTKCQRIFGLVAQATLEISKAEGIELEEKGKLSVSPEKLREVLGLKAVVPETCMKIGAILGDADESTVDVLGQVGRLFGVASLMVEEFMDLLEIAEFKSRLRNECPPLPFLCVLRNAQLKAILMPIVSAKRLSKAKHKEVMEIILGSREVQALKEEMLNISKNAIQKACSLRSNRAREQILTLLSALPAYLEVVAV